MQHDDIEKFKTIVTRFYTDHGRHDMLWRQPEPDGTFDPYKILVSELMLQQTQVARVTPKFAAFTGAFPTVEALAAASLQQVLQLWTGLGYNRRAKYLWQAAQMITNEYGGIFPRTAADLQKLPGVGPNTAGAITAYAYNQPVVFVETNIRTVIIHHFFQDETNITDVTIRQILADVLPTANEQTYLQPREFYWAMMDYGTYLKQLVGNLNRASKTYAKQTIFEGSRRQLRGKIIRLLADRNYTVHELGNLLADERSDSVIADLAAESMISRRGDVLSISP